MMRAAAQAAYADHFITSLPKGYQMELAEDAGNISQGERQLLTIARAMQAGALVACFPEGTTSHGASVGRFHGALFQPAIDAGAIVMPVLLRYTDRQGRSTQDCCYVGEDSLLASVWRIVSARAHSAELRFLAPMDAAGHDRRGLAQEAHAALSMSLAKTLSGN